MAQGYLARKKLAMKIFKCVYKIVFKVQISSPLQTWLIDGRKETSPHGSRIQFENFPCKTWALDPISNRIHSFYL